MNLGYLYAKFFKKILRGKAILNSRIDSSTVIYSGCHIVNSDIGKYTYVSYDSSIVDAIIGKFCSIAPQVTIGAAEHPISWVSTSPVFENVKNSGPCKRFAKLEVPKPEKTIIGSDVWIGQGATIKSGIRIGDGAVIGTQALVTKNVPPYAVVGGVPAKVLKFRFTEEIISQLLDLKWWDLNDDTLYKYGKYIDSPLTFIDLIKKYQERCQQKKV